MYSQEGVAAKPLDWTGWMVLAGSLILFPLLHSSGAAALTYFIFFVFRVSMNAVLALSFWG